MVGPRFTWIVKIAELLGVSDKELSRVVSQKQAVELILDLWRNTHKQVGEARDELVDHLIALSDNDLRQRAIVKLNAAQIQSTDFGRLADPRALAEVIARASIQKPWETASEQWQAATRVQRNWRVKKYNADWQEWQENFRKWLVVSAVRGIRGRPMRPREPRVTDYCSARECRFAKTTASFLRDMDRLHPDESTAASQLVECMQKHQDLTPPLHLLGAVSKAHRQKHSALARLRWSSTYWMNGSLGIERMDTIGSNQRPALTLISSDTHESLRRWRLAVVLSTLVLFASICGYMIVFWPRRGWNHHTRQEYVALSSLIVGIGLAMLIFIAWGTSLVLSVGLTKDALADLKDNCKSWYPKYGKSMGTDGWDPLIQRPALELVHNTLPALAAWETPVCWTALSHALFVALSLPLALALYHNHEGKLATRYVMLVLVFAATVVPLLVLYLPASISSTVNILLDDINEMRMQECNDSFRLERDQRAANLLQYLDRCNNHRGPGFLLFGTVVLDIRLLKAAVFSAGALVGNFIIFFKDIPKQ
eukprot:COSAG02_NODE_4403_length_5401_cov_69.946247_2_plen_538_part_00